jgi:PLD-like domain
MQLTEYTIGYLKEYISGENGSTPKLSGPKIIELFNSVGFNDIYTYGSGMPEGLSRNEFVLDRLKKCNNSKRLETVFETVFSKRHFLRDQTLELNVAVEKVNEILSVDGYLLSFQGENYSVCEKDGFSNIMNSEVHFEELQSKIKLELEKAEFMIWVAVAWFTDAELYNLLSKKRMEGLSVQVIINDDDINSNSGLNLGKDFFVMKIPKEGHFQNIMHHKFCVIDLKTVIHGSYNWTKKAQYNRETLEFKTGRKLAETFSKEFIKLRQNKT